MKTEIFGTFGPACDKEKILLEMIEAGMTGMRLNLSHTTLSASENYIKAYQEAAKKAGVKPQILIDIQGPELRIGEMAASVELKEDTQVLICENKNYQEMHRLLSVNESKHVIPVPVEVLRVLEEDDEVLIDDGKILVKIEALAVEKNDCEMKYQSYQKARVLRGGVLHSHKSVKIVAKNVKMPALTEYDIANIKQAKVYGVTALMQPFVLSGEDLRYVRSVLIEYGAKDIQIFAKIENRLGVENIEDILQEADVLVIARGDLGNDMPLWELPRVQKEIEEACHKFGKPYIVVTQMLTSMESNPVPTRAEVSDIFHAVYHGAWGVMVTGETAVGKYPIEVIRYLVNTAKQAREI